MTHYEHAARLVAADLVSAWRLDLLTDAERDALRTDDGLRRRCEAYDLEVTAWLVDDEQIRTFCLSTSCGCYGERSLNIWEHWLHDAETGERIRKATAWETTRSKLQADFDGGYGFIIVDDNRKAFVR